jgi:hypothetical protein
MAKKRLTHWGIKIGPAFEEGWNRSAIPTPISHPCSHCRSTNSTLWILEKKVFAFGNIITKKSSAFECLDCGNEEVSAEKSKPKPKSKSTVTLNQWKSLSPEARDFLLSQLGKKK